MRRLVEDGRLNDDGVVLLHAPLKHPQRPVLLPNVCYLRDSHPLFKVPRVIVEFCVNGTISGDPTFRDGGTIVAISFDELKNRCSGSIINAWPTGFAVLGPVNISPGPDIRVSNHSLDLDPQDAEPSASKGKLLTNEARARALLTSFGAEHFKVASRMPGEQNTTWEDPRGLDHLHPQQREATQAMFEAFASKHGIPSAGSNYQSSTCRYLHRLCAFFMGFRLLGADTYWLSFVPERADRAILRMDEALRQSEQRISEETRASPSWRLVKMYHQVAVFLMSIHKRIIDEGHFGLEYLQLQENIRCIDEATAAAFYQGARKAMGGFSQSHVRNSAIAYHAVRDKLRPQFPIDASHPYVRRLIEMAEQEHAVEQLHVATIGDLMQIWANIVDSQFPEFVLNAKILTDEISHCQGANQYV